MSTKKSDKEKEKIIAKSEDTMDDAAKEPLDHPDVPMLPPIVFLLFLIGGLVLDWLMPINFGHGWGAFGLILLIGALGVIAWCNMIFEKAGTNISPEKPSLTIIKEGPYAYSRNPIYVCFLVAYLGLAMLADAPVMILLTGALFFVLGKYVIQREEEYLEATFGEEYLDYKSKVGRWF